MKRVLVALLILVSVGGLVLVGCGRKETTTQRGLSPDEQKAVDYVLDYVWTDPSTSKKSARSIGDSIKVQIGAQPWSKGQKVFELGDWEVDKFDKNVFYVKVLVKPNNKAWAIVGKKAKSAYAIWKVDYKEKRVFATNAESGFLSWVEK